MNFDKKYSISQYQLYDEFKAYAKIGDIVITQTDNLLYQAVRSVLHITYDHLSVLIKEDQLFHISWPKIRIIHPINLLSESSKFTVIRPSYQEGELDKFIKYLETSLNANYDFQAFALGAQRKFLQQILNGQTTYSMKMKKTRVCTDLVFYSLDASSSRFRDELQKNIGYLDYHLIGSFTPDDLFTLSKLSTYFYVIKTSEIQSTQEFKTLKKLLKTLDVSELFSNSLNPLRKLITKIPAPQKLFEIGENVIGSLNLLNFLLMPKRQKIRLLVRFIFKRLGKDKIKEEYVKKITKKVITAVEILDLISLRPSMKNYIKLMVKLVQLLTFRDLTYQEIYTLILQFIKKGKL